MRKAFVLLLSAVLLLGGCGTYTGEGAYVGGQFGSVIGSAIGGISGGPRGSDLGTLVGMAGGAAIGAVVGSAADKAQQEKYEQYQRERDERYGRRGYDSRRDDGGAYGDEDVAYNDGDTPAGSDESGFDPTNSGDDRITFDDTPASNDVYTTVEPRTVSMEQLKHTLPGYRMRLSPLIEVRNATFVDRDGDGVLRAGEECKVSFEIMNRSSMTLYDITPTVVETTGNKHIHISPSIRVENIAPGMGVRYTATVLAGKRLKDGEAVIRVAVAQGNNEITSQVEEFRVKTSRK